MSNSIMRRNPLREMADMRNVMDRIFEQTWQPFFEQGELSENTLALDIHEDDQAYTVFTDMPGINPDNINVRLEGGFLLIEGQSAEQQHRRITRQATPADGEDTRE